ncbi:DUF2608 domain-containing protein [Candidatus Nucleicultrix amoebiphila]|uniref:Uncharacterized protein n=1 Tax=Candidatus Nucleicultrix amoebiphila FS5 TaxID=1414854 RepID=A0A1W6N518_9PROT|nr:DUF2608 domain-containing protein [Candidatus Nucleicultrix amoebiphila]ARN84964.1 hypothetical protein GQ61_06330 [Candidatus Nucleicultrix amoebiphila FS5]
MYFNFISICLFGLFFPLSSHATDVLSPLKVDEGEASSTLKIRLNVLGQQSEEKVKPQGVNLQCSEEEIHEPTPLKQPSIEQQSSPKKENSFPIVIEEAQKVEKFKHVDFSKFVNEEEIIFAFFDIDKTLVMENFLTLHLSSPDRLYFLKAFKEGSNFDGDEEQYQKFEQFYASYTLDCLTAETYPQTRLVEDCIVDKLKFLKSKKVIVVGLTARHGAIAGLTHADLKSKGIDFEDLSGLGDHEVIHKDSPETLKHGTYFTGNHRKKAEAIPELVAEILRKLDILKKLENTSPVKIRAFHFDDNLVEIAGFKKGDVGSSERLPGPLTIYPIYYAWHDNFMNKLVEKPNQLFREIDEDFYYERFLPQQLDKMTREVNENRSSTSLDEEKK